MFIRRPRLPTVIASSDLILKQSKLNERGLLSSRLSSKYSQTESRELVHCTGEHRCSVRHENQLAVVLRESTILRGRSGEFTCVHTCCAGQGISQCLIIARLGFADLSNHLESPDGIFLTHSRGETRQEEAASESIHGSKVNTK